MTQPDPFARHESTDAAPRQVVVSPEQVALDLAIAGPTSRMLAYAVDFLAIVLLWIGLFALLVGSTFAGPLADWIRAALERVSGTGSEGDASALLLVLSVLVALQLFIEFVYFVMLELATGGRSLGKAFLGLRVVCDGGRPIGLRESVVRTLLRAVDVLPAYYIVGLVSILLSPEGKRLGDLAAGTIVIRLDRAPGAAPLHAGAGDPGRFRFDRAQVARIGASERRLVRQTLRRIDSVPHERAAALLARATEVLRGRIGYAPVEPHEQADFLRALLGAAERR